MCHWDYLPILNCCCCCIKLRHGAILLGVIGLVGAITQIVRLVPDLETSGPTVYQHFSLCFTNVLMSITLLVGVLTKSKVMLVVYLFFSLVFMLVLSIVGYERFLEGNTYAGIGMVGIIVLMLYFWWCIESYYQELKEEEQRLKKKFLLPMKKTETIV